MRLPSPPVISAAVSGFVVGVLVTLLASGALGRSAAARPRKPTPVPVTSVREQVLQTKLRRLATRVLGPDPRGSSSRVLSVTVSEVSSSGVVSVPPEIRRKYESVKLTFRLNDHPLGRTWRLREAKADVFGLLKAIYTSGLPIYSTELVGRFSKGKQAPYNAVVTYMTYRTSTGIPWKRWGRSHEAQIWSLLDYHAVDRRFG